MPERPSDAPSENGARPPSSASPRIAVWNTAFLGDAVLTLPLLRVVRAAWPRAELDFYVRGGLEGLFAAQPELNRVYAYDKRGAQRGLKGAWRQGLAARARRYDIWIGAHESPRSSAMAVMSGARRRVGYREAAFSALAYNARVDRHFAARQEIERLLGLALPLLEPLGLGGLLRDPALTWPELRLPLEAQEGATALLAALPPGPILGVHPGSVWPTKCWTPEGFAHIVRRGIDSGANVVLLASPPEAATAAHVLKLAERAESPRLLNLAGKTSLPVLAAVLGRLQSYVTNDSGPMHLAWAQRVPVTAVFGPTTRALGFAPRGDSTVVETDEPCRPCGLHGHKTCPQGHFRCMRGIDPEVVWRSAEARLFPWKSGAAERARAGAAFDI